MTGMRKFWFGVISIAALLGGVAVAAAVDAPVEVYSSFSWSVVFCSIGYGSANAAVHVARAYETVKGNANKPKS